MSGIDTDKVSCKANSVADTDFYDPLLKGWVLLFKREKAEQRLTAFQC